MSTYITVAIPYVNAPPHLGYAYELVEADLAARARRALGQPVRFLGGTDDYSLKNVLAAADAGEPTRDFVDRHADRFAALAEPLGITFDDFIRTSRDPRHVPAVERLWRACEATGDLYLREYAGAYCVGCEQYYEGPETGDGHCPEHATPLDTVVETNWFFRLSRYQGRLIELIEGNTLLIEPEPYRSEILAFLGSGVRDISVSRSAERARGWGVPVPDDPSQVIYVWFDALTNYVSALGYGTGDVEYGRWWRTSDERIHVVGKGIVRFHAVYWPAFLLAAGEPLPTRIRVHPYLTVDGQKISKSAGNGASPLDLAEAWGSDVLRWWVARDVSETSDTDFTVDRLTARADDDLANGLGNAVNRVLSIRHRHASAGESCSPCRTADPTLAHAVFRALAEFHRRAATDLIRSAIDDLNRDIEATAPWTLLGRTDRARELTDVLDRYLSALWAIAAAIDPITPDLAARIREQLDTDPATRPTPVQPRLEPHRHRPNRSPQVAGHAT